jgi:hypothetical protein
MWGLAKSKAEGMARRLLLTAVEKSHPRQVLAFDGSNRVKAYRTKVHFPGPTCLKVHKAEVAKMDSPRKPNGSFRGDKFLPFAEYAGRTREVLF